MHIKLQTRFFPDNDALPSLYGLDSIDHATITGLEIIQSDVLIECAVKSICNYLEIPTNLSTIYNNYIGCNTRVEITSACPPSVSVSNPPGVEIDIIPNPTDGRIEIRGLEKGHICIIDSFGRIHSEQQFSGSSIDISELPGGLYILELRDENQSIVKRIVKL